MIRRKLLLLLAVTMAIIFAAGSANADLVGFWTFDEGTATTGPGGIKDLATDDGSHDGTLFGGTFSTYVPAVLKGGRSLDLRNGTSYVLIDSCINGALEGDFDTGSALSVAFWVKGWGAGEESFVTNAKDQYEDTPGWQVRTAFWGVNLDFTINGTTGHDVMITAKGHHEEPDWFHVVATYDGTYRKIYVNGVQEEWNRIDKVIYDDYPDTGSISSSGTNVCFGGNYNRDTGALSKLSNVMLDDIGIWDHAITLSEVQDLYDGISPVGVKNVHPENHSVVNPGRVNLSWTNLQPKFGSITYVDVRFGTDPLTMTKLPNVSGYINKRSIAVENVAHGQYYWRVDSYLYGTSNGIPTEVGQLYTFTTDDPLESFKLDAPAKITWLGKEVGLQVEDLLDDGRGAVTYNWTCTPDGSGDNDLTVILDPVAGNPDAATLVVYNSSPTGEKLPVTVTVTAKDELNPPVSRSVTIDVFDTICLATHGAALGLDSDYKIDCQIDYEDLEIMALAWLTDYDQTDHNNDGTTNLVDLMELASQWSKGFVLTKPTSLPIPEIHPVTRDVEPELKNSGTFKLAYNIGYEGTLIRDGIVFIGKTFPELPTHDLGTINGINVKIIGLNGTVQDIFANNLTDDDIWSTQCYTTGGHLGPGKDMTIEITGLNPERNYRIQVLHRLPRQAAYKDGAVTATATTIDNETYVGTATVSYGFEEGVSNIGEYGLGTIEVTEAVSLSYHLPIAANGMGPGFSAIVIHEVYD